MKVVVVSQRVDEFAARCEMRDALDQQLVAFLLTCGFLPVPVPNNLGDCIGEWLAVIKPAGFVLSGGNDVGLSLARDATESALLAYAKHQRLPLLGICRGMQMIANWVGADLRSVEGHLRTRHSISGEITGIVNSYHAFSLASCPEGFKILAKSDDGEVEAIRHLCLPWEGWMWHPERELSFSIGDLERIKVLFGG